jgi:hypothetical protein
MMNYIVYKTTNLTNNKIYIGIHKQEGFEFDGYFGSGILLNTSIKKYGQQNFVRETLFIYDDLILARNKEREIVTEAFCKMNNNYNLSVGGTGGNTMAGYSQEMKSVITEKIRQTKILNGSNVYVGDKLKRAIARMKYARIQPDNRGRIHEGVSLENMRMASKNRIGCNVWITNGINTILSRVGDIIPEGWKQGRGDDVQKFTTHTQESKDKISEKIKGDVCYNNGISNLKIKSWDIPPEGYFRGMIQKHDRVWITNDQISKVIKRNDDIPTGWRMGRTIKQRNSNEK